MASLRNYGYMQVRDSVEVLAKTPRCSSLRSYGTEDVECMHLHIRVAPGPWGLTAEVAVASEPA